jgi:hypothetical protein
MGSFASCCRSGASQDQEPDEQPSGLPASAFDTPVTQPQSFVPDVSLRRGFLPATTAQETGASPHSSTSRRVSIDLQPDTSTSAHGTRNTAAGRSAADASSTSVAVPPAVPTRTAAGPIAIRPSIGSDHMTGSERYIRALRSMDAPVPSSGAGSGTFNAIYTHSRSPLATSPPERDTMMDPAVAVMADAAQNAVAAVARVSPMHSRSTSTYLARYGQGPSSTPGVSSDRLVTRSPNLMGGPLLPSGQGAATLGEPAAFEPVGDLPQLRSTMSLLAAMAAALPGGLPAAVRQA